MSNLSHHQRQLLHLMGIQLWAESTTPCVQIQSYRLWRDEDLDVSDVVSSISNVPTQQTTKQYDVEPMLDSDVIIDDIDDTCQLSNSHQLNLAKQILKNASNHQVELQNHQDLIDKNKIQIDEHHIVIQHKFEQNIFVASCISEHMVLLTQFDVDIQAPHHAEREDVQLWQNIRKFFNQTQIRLAQKEIQHQVLIWNYDFIDIEPNMMGYFQQGYIETITQQKKVLLLGNWQGSDVAEHWQQLPSLAQMLQHADAKRQVYRAMMAVMQ